MPNTLPQTSHDAYKQVSPEMLTNHHSKIIEALRASKNGLMYEQIAAQIKMDKHQVGRRLSELEAMQIIYKPGEKRLTSTNRSAYVYKLVQNGEKSAQKEKVLEGESIAEISRKMFPPIQKELFDDQDNEPYQYKSSPMTSKIRASVGREPNGDFKLPD